MAAPTNAGFGMGVHDGDVVHEADEEARGLGLSAENPIGLDDKNGEDGEEVRVAKKARVEKAHNGLAGEDDGDDAGYGVDSGDGFADKEAEEPELDPLLGHDNGAAGSLGEAEAEAEGEGDGEDEEDSENGGVGGGVDDDDEDDESADADADADVGVVTGKDAPGDAGLRTLLQESDATKPGGLLNGTDAVTHATKAAK